MANRTKVGRQRLHSLLRTGMGDFHFKYLDSIFFWDRLSTATIAKYPSLLFNSAQFSGIQNISGTDESSASFNVTLEANARQQDAHITIAMAL